MPVDRKDGRRLPEAGTAWNRFSLTASKGSSPAGSLTSGLWPPEVCCQPALGDGNLSVVIQRPLAMCGPGGPEPGLVWPESGFHFNSPKLDQPGTAVAATPESPALDAIQQGGGFPEPGCILPRLSGTLACMIRFPALGPRDVPSALSRTCLLQFYSRLVDAHALGLSLHTISKYSTQTGCLTTLLTCLLSHLSLTAAWKCT